MRIARHLIVISFSFSGVLLAQGNAKLSENADYKNGVSALTDHLPDLAVKRFQDVLKAEDLKNEDRQKVLLLLTESQILAIQPNEALETLKDEALKDHVDLPFWKGQALAAGGLYRQAIIELSGLSVKSKLYAENLLTLAQLNLSLGKEDVAKNHLEKVIKQKLKQSSKNKAILLLAELYLDSSDAKKAATLIKQVKSPSKGTLQTQKLLSSRIALSEKNYESAISQLEALIAEAPTVSEHIQNLAYVYLADARHASGDNKSAVNGLLDFLDAHRDSPMLGSIFDRLESWMPEGMLPNDPVVLKLREWAKRGTTPETSNYDAADKDEQDLCAFSHYLYALYLAGTEVEENVQQALVELETLRTRHSTHILAGTSLTDTALLQLKQEKIEDALKTLDKIQNLTIPIAPRAKQQAAFLKGQLRAEKKDYAAAAEAFSFASESLNEKVSDSSSLNAGIAYLASSDLKGFQNLKNSRKNELIKRELQLELALWSASQHEVDARTQLHDFLRENPKHQRRVEAWLALASHAVTIDPIDADLCQAAIEQLRNAELDEGQYDQYSRVRYRLAEARGDFLGASDVAGAYLKAYPKSDKVPEFLLLKGLALHRNNQHNAARQTLNTFTKGYPEHPLFGYALYYSGMAAKSEGTPQAKNEAVALFDQVIKLENELSIEAELQKADILESLNMLKQAEELLRKTYAKKLSLEQKLDAGMLLSSVLHSQGAEAEEKYGEALKIYDAMLTEKQLSLTSIYRIRYRKALTLSIMGDVKGALDVYYQVINRENIPANSRQSEWFWYYKCGFNAMTLCEDNDNPRGAIAIAKKLATGKGPQAEEAKKRAKRLEMEYMIWEQ